MSANRKDTENEGRDGFRLGMVRNVNSSDDGGKKEVLLAVGMRWTGFLLIKRGG